MANDYIELKDINKQKVSKTINSISTQKKKD